MAFLAFWPASQLAGAGHKISECMPCFVVRPFGLQMAIFRSSTKRSLPGSSIGWPSSSEPRRADGAWSSQGAQWTPAPSHHSQVEIVPLSLIAQGGGNANNRPYTEEPAMQLCHEEAEAWRLDFDCPYGVSSNRVKAATSRCSAPK